MRPYFTINKKIIFDHEYGRIDHLRVIIPLEIQFNFSKKILVCIYILYKAMLHSIECLFLNKISIVDQDKSRTYNQFQV